MWFTNLKSYYPDPDGTAGGSAPDGAKNAVDAAPGGTDAKPAPKMYDEATFNEVKNQRDALKKEAEKRKAAEAAAEQKRQIAAGEFDKVKAALEQERDSYKAQVDDLMKFKKAVDDAQKAELDELVNTLSDEDKATVSLGADVAAQIKLAKRFATTQPPPNGGPPVVPGRNSQHQNDAKTRETARQNRDMQTYYQTMPVIKSAERN